MEVDPLNPPWIRYRTRPKPQRVDPPPARVWIGPYLPLRVLEDRRRKEIERMAKEGVFAGTASDLLSPQLGGSGRDVWGQAHTTAIMPRDEREKRPLALLDHQPGRKPLLVLGGGQRHWQELKEMADETRHYTEDMIEPEPLPEDYYEQRWREIIERRRRRLQRRTVSGYGLLAKGGY